MRTAVCWALAGLAVASFAAHAQAATVTLAWDANTESDLAGYYLYYDTDAGDPYSGSLANGNGANEGDSPVDIPLSALADPDNPEYSLTGLESCEHFYFALTAYDTAVPENESDYSDEVDATLIATLDPVTAGPAGSGELLVEWEAPPGDDQGSIPLYRIYYDTDSGEPYEAAGSPLEVLASNLSDEAAPDWTVPGLTNGTPYYIVIEAECGDGATKRSEEATGTPTDRSTGGAGSGAEGPGGTGGTGTGTGGTGLAGTGGGSSAGGAGSVWTASDDEGGCACRMGSNGQGRSGFGLLVLALGLAARRRARGRGRRRCAPTH